ncbi:MAG: hypothetical protein QMD76_08750 [Anaerosomatales bacterium]|nr:hypothetical protein [Anaerosomatales bacterium]
MSAAPKNHDTAMMMIHMVLLFPFEFGNSYSWRWIKSTSIQIQKTSDRSPKMPRHA